MSQRPILPYVLGIAGLVPFVFFSIEIFTETLTHQSRSFVFLLWYAAIILSFLGGTRWGAEIALRPQSPSKSVLLLAMLPSILAWGTLIYFELWGIRHNLGAISALGMFILAFAAQLQWDFSAVDNGTFPRWYKPLRILLSVVAIASMAAPFFVGLNATFASYN